MYITNTSKPNLRISQTSLAGIHVAWAETKNRKMFDRYFCKRGFNVSADSVDQYQSGKSA